MTYKFLSFSRCPSVGMGSPSPLGNPLKPSSRWGSLNLIRFTVNLLNGFFKINIIHITRHKQDNTFFSSEQHHEPEEKSLWTPACGFPPWTLRKPDKQHFRWGRTRFSFKKEFFRCFCKKIRFFIFFLSPRPTLVFSNWLHWTWAKTTSPGFLQVDYDHTMCFMTIVGKYFKNNHLFFRCFQNTCESAENQPES